MKVFKFGGASVKDADGVKNLAKIVGNFNNQELIIVVSAMGKTTNALEKVAENYYSKTGSSFDLLNTVRRFHIDILDALYPKNHAIYHTVENLFIEIEWIIEDDPTGSYDFEYDQIVSVGELLSSKIVHAYLHEVDIACNWLDVRDIIKTDNNYRDAEVDWNLSQQYANSRLSE